MTREYKVGNKLKVKSLAWYDKNKGSRGSIATDDTFVFDMKKYCGKVLTITGVEKDWLYTRFHMYEDDGEFCWNPFMFEDNNEQLEFEF